MKWLKETIILLLLFLIGFLLYDFINQNERFEEANQQLKTWQDAYAELADTHDALDSAYVRFKSSISTNG